MRSTSATAVSSTSLTTTWSNSGALVSSNSALATRLAITSGASEPAFQFLDRRRHDEDGAGVGAEDAFEVDPSQHVDVEQNGMPFPPDAVEFAAQRAVAGAGIDLLPFDETLFVDRPAEFVGREEIVVHAVPRGAREVAEIENSSWGIRRSNSRTMVVLPEPLGAEKMMSFPMRPDIKLCFGLTVIKY